jgi:hypothetical protein
MAAGSGTDYKIQRYNFFENVAVQHLKTWQYNI